MPFLIVALSMPYFTNLMHEKFEATSHFFCQELKNGISTISPNQKLLGK